MPNQNPNPSPLSTFAPQNLAERDRIKDNASRKYYQTGNKILEADSVLGRIANEMVELWRQEQVQEAEFGNATAENFAEKQRAVLDTKLARLTKLDINLGLSEEYFVKYNNHLKDEMDSMESFSQVREQLFAWDEQKDNDDTITDIRGVYQTLLNDLYREGFSPEEVDRHPQVRVMKDLVDGLNFKPNLWQKMRGVKPGSFDSVATDLVAKYNTVYAEHEAQYIKNRDYAEMWQRHKEKLANDRADLMREIQAIKATKPPEPKPEPEPKDPDKDLLERIKNLEEELKRVKQENEELKRENERLKQENEALKKEIVELKKGDENKPEDKEKKDNDDIEKLKRTIEELQRVIEEQRRRDQNIGAGINNVIQVIQGVGANIGGMPVIPVSVPPSPYYPYAPWYPGYPAPPQPPVQPFPGYNSVDNTINLQDTLKTVIETLNKITNVVEVNVTGGSGSDGAKKQEGDKTVIIDDSETKVGGIGGNIQIGNRFADKMTAYRGLESNLDQDILKQLKEVDEDYGTEWYSVKERSFKEIIESIVKKKNKGFNATQQKIIGSFADKLNLLKLDNGNTRLLSDYIVFIKNNLFKHIGSTKTDKKYFNDILNKITTELLKTNFYRRRKINNNQTPPVDSSPVAPVAQPTTKVEPAPSSPKKSPDLKPKPEPKESFSEHINEFITKYDGFLKISVDMFLENLKANRFNRPDKFDEYLANARKFGQELLDRLKVIEAKFPQEKDKVKTKSQEIKQYLVEIEQEAQKYLSSNERENAELTNDEVDEDFAEKFDKQFGAEKEGDKSKIKIGDWVVWDGQTEPKQVRRLSRDGSKIYLKGESGYVELSQKPHKVEAA